MSGCCCNIFSSYMYVLVCSVKNSFHFSATRLIFVILITALRKQKKVLSVSHPLPRVDSYMKKIAKHIPNFIFTQCYTKLYVFST